MATQQAPGQRMQNQEVQALVQAGAAGSSTVGAYMCMMEEESANDAEHVYEIGALLEGEAAAWLVGLFEEDVPELRDFNHFMISL
uniref:Uncharacterized protein n=1 Tax=Sphaerodactylus townsendi TaxID=933632 RepID=A0ACB8FGT5_9SAUR